MFDGLNSLNQWLQDTIFNPLKIEKLPVMEHLVELRSGFDVRAVIITAVVFVGTFFYADMLVKWLLHSPPEHVCIGLSVVGADRSAYRSVRLSRAG